MKIRVLESNVYEYVPEFEDDSWYEDHGVKTVEEAIVVDKKWIDDKRGGMRELIPDSQDGPTTERVWQLIGDDDEVVATF